MLQSLRLLNEEGLFVGGSSGMNVSAACKVAEMMGPGHTIVTALCDSGQVCQLHVTYSFTDIPSMFIFTPGMFSFKVSNYLR